MKNLWPTPNRVGVFFVLFIVLTHLVSQAVFAEQPSPLQQQDYLDLVAKVDDIMVAYHYKPSELQSSGYQTTLASMKELANRAESKGDFVARFNQVWQNGPFSHVNMVASEHTAKQMAMYLDNMRVGGQGALLSWQNKTAILTVNTMMGADTIEQIQDAYQVISQRKAKALIIDLRKNEGGAFATRPLVSHLIKEPLDAGYFVSQKWTAHHSRLPNSAELEQVEPWDGWSIVAFWDEIQDAPIIKVSFQPASVVVDLPVYVLISQQTSSAAEFATEALQSAGRVTVVGEPSAGKMLSQKPFDLPHQLQVFVPIADYYSLKTGRIEANPIQPNVYVKSEQAMDVAKKLIEKL